MGKQATVDFGKIADAGDNGGKQQGTENLPATTDTPSQDLPKKKLVNSAPKYVPIAKLIELRKKGLTHKEIGKIVGITRENVTRRLCDVDIPGIETFKRNRADVFAYHQEKLLNSITQSDIKKAPMRDKIVAAGILYDKERLERDLSTQNVMSIVADLEAVRKAHNNA